MVAGETGHGRRVRRRSVEVQQADWSEVSAVDEVGQLLSVTP
jgi:hypothetical protein